MDSATPVALSKRNTVDSYPKYIHDARAIMRTGGYKYSIRCSNLSVDEVIPGLTGPRYSSNGNKTWCRAKVGNVDGRIRGLRVHAPVRMHTQERMVRYT